MATPAQIELLKKAREKAAFNRLEKKEKEGKLSIAQIDALAKARAAAMASGKLGQSVGSARALANQMRDTIAELVQERFAPVVKAQLDAAIGITIQETDEDGHVTYKDLPPSTQAAKLLFEYVLGKPTEHVEVKGQFTILSLISNLESRALEEEGE